MGQVLHRGLLQGHEPVGVAVLWRQRLVSTMSWQRLGGFRKVTDGDLVRRSWVDGSEERLWKPSIRGRGDMVHKNQTLYLYSRYNLSIFLGTPKQSLITIKTKTTIII